MKFLILTASMWALVASKPELYREKEDFEYSRSSSDDGTKAGYYGAQRGNMGGNYERAHNMDALAQHQMSTLVRNVDGELGEGANSRAGSVYSAAVSKGLYGSGHYDLSNLSGRNFREGTSYADSLSQSNLGYSGHGSLYSAADNAKYINRHSQSSTHRSGYETSGLASQYLQTDAQKAAASGYQTSGLDSQYLYTDAGKATASNYGNSGLASQYLQTDAQKADNVYGATNYEHGTQTGNNYKYAQSSSQARSDYENTNNANGYDYKTSSSLIHATPVRIYIRPGTRVAIPVAARVYDTSVDQNAINTDSVIYKPTNNAKHYESSYSYRKEWEKKNAIPVTIAPTENPFPLNSELYEDVQSQTANNNLYEGELSVSNSQASSANSAYSSSYSASRTESASQARHQSQTYNSGAAASNAYTHNAYDAAAAANLYGSHISDALADSNKLIEDIAAKPKSYHSSYSYHKSWERRGDPYVIKPVGGVTSQKLTAALANPSYICTYCEDDSQQRVRRSLSTEHHQPSENLNYGQKKQSGNGLGIDDDSGKLEDLGQQTQDKLKNFGQQTQNNQEDLGQQTQSHWKKVDEFFQEMGDKLEDLGQQIEKKLEDFSQQTGEKLEALGQQTQDKLEDLGKKTDEKLEDLGPQIQDKLEEFGQQILRGKLGEFGQKTEDKLENSSRQTQSHWGESDNCSQQTQKEQPDWAQQVRDRLEGMSQQPRSQWDNQDNLSQKTQDGLPDWAIKVQDRLECLNQQTRSHRDNEGNSDQKTQNKQRD